MKCIMFPLPFHLVFILIPIVSPANILFYSSVSSYSHRVVMYPLADSLAKLGHHVTYISPFHPRNPSEINQNITEIVPQKLAQIMEDFWSSDFDINFRVNKTLPRNVDAYFPFAAQACEVFLSSPELRHYLDRTTKLDLIILDSCLTECAMGLVHKYKAKHVHISTIAMIPSDHDFFGLYPESSAIPELEIFPPRVPMSFFERVQNALISLEFRYGHYNYLYDIDKLIRKYMKVDDPIPMPFVDDLARNTSLILHTGDVISDNARSLPPLMVNVAGIHCKHGRNSSELPEDIKSFLQGNTDGFIYISLGSLVVPSTLPQKVRQVFLEIIEKNSKLKFLWKWNGAPPTEKLPSNLLISKWFPQQDLLAHPNIKAFISQCGRPSTLESICHGVPMIAFPIMGDQDSNANRINDMGGNIKLELGTVTNAELDAAIKEITYGSRIRERMQQLKMIFEDRPLSPLDTAVWWTEYVLRHKDTSHLRPAGFNQNWYQRRLLDVWAFLFTTVIALFACIIAVSLVIFRVVCKQLNRNGSEGRGRSANKTKNKKNA